MNERRELSAYSKQSLPPGVLRQWWGHADREEDPAVLMVSADQKVLTLMPVAAARRGLVCDAVESLAEVRQLRASTVYDIVFLDATLPDGSGTEILRERRNFASHAVAIVVSAERDAERALELLRHGAHDLFLAPGTSDSIAQWLEWGVEEWRSRIGGIRYRAKLEQTLRSRTRTLLRAMKEIDRLYEASVQAIASTLDMRLPETGEHSRRVAENSALIGDSLGLPAIGLRDLRWGACLHDIGKIAVPDLILTKQGALSEDELLIVRAHTIHGSEMLSRVRFLSGAREAVLSHHERYDGTGYPYGLQGEEIPLSARIVAVADAFDAMIHDRPYHRALSLRAVTEQLEREAGYHYDPTVVESFLRCRGESRGTWLPRIAQ